MASAPKAPTQSHSHSQCATRGAGPRTRIVLINEDILVNEDKFVCSKIRIVCIFEDMFFLWSSGPGGQGLQIGLLKVLKMDSLSKNTSSSLSTLGVVRLPEELH